MSCISALEPIGFGKSTPIGAFADLPAAFPIPPMKTIAEIRRENLQELIDQVGGGSIAEMNERMGWDRTDPRLTRIRNANVRGDRGKPFQMGDGMAREIEQKFGLEEGWMDNVHQRVEALTADEETGTNIVDTEDPGKAQKPRRPTYGHDYRTVAYSMAAAIETTPGAAKVSLRAFLQMVDAAFDQLKGPRGPRQ
jgi:hypothetical protein